MIAAEINPAFGHREDPGKWGSLALTFFIHGVLALVLFYGVQWQRRPPEPIQVELVRSLPPPAAVPAPPKPVVTPEPPKPVSKVVEPEPVKKPDIALSKPVEKPKPKEKPPVEPPKPVEKPKPQEKPPAEPAKPQISPRELEAQRMRDMLLMESDKARRQLQSQANAANKAERESAVARVNSKAEAEWLGLISQKVRGNLSAPPFSGNPEAEFSIELFPTGDVATVRLRRSSGNKALDDAMERAIWNSKPLPMPSRPEVFQRNLTFVFKPRGD